MVRLANGSLRVYVIQEDGKLQLLKPTLADAEVRVADLVVSISACSTINAHAHKFSTLRNAASSSERTTA